MKKSKAKPTGIIKPTAVKEYIKKAKGMRSKDDAVGLLIIDLDVVLDAVLDDAKALAQAEKRTTILKKDMAAAIEKNLKRQDLPWDETAKEVIKHNPADLGHISQALRDWIRAHEDKKKG